MPQRTNRFPHPTLPRLRGRDKGGEVRVKRCGKSAPRVRQRKRHGKPHREQNRIGTATRDVRASDNSAGRCQARRPGRLLEAMCKYGPRGMAVTYRPRKRAVPYKTRLTGWLIFLTKAFSKKTRLTENEGFGVTRRTPRHFLLPSLRANGSRECAPDDRLREAIHLSAQRKNGLLRRIRLRPKAGFGGLKGSSQ